MIINHSSVIVILLLCYQQRVHIIPSIAAFFQVNSSSTFLLGTCKKFTSIIQVIGTDMIHVSIYRFTI